MIVPGRAHETDSADRIGNDQAGFSAGFDLETNAVRVRAWGFWSADVANAFGSRVSHVCRARPCGSALVMDMSELKPMRDEGQRSFRLLLGELASLGIRTATIKTDNQLTRLQLRRLASQIGGGTRISFT
jgi:hypothetical protein